MTYLWKKSIRRNIYSYQTTDLKVAKNLRKIPGAKLVSYAMNSFDEIYEIPAGNMENAKNILRQVTQQEIYPFGDGFMAKEQLALDLKC